MSNVVLDTSAIVALIKGEPGAERVHPVAAGAVVSAVTVAELASLSTRDGAPADVVAEVIDDLRFTVEPFDRSRALAAGLLVGRTGHRGLSLGDRACLALAMELKLPVITADRAWRDLDLGIDIQLIR